MKTITILDLLKIEVSPLKKDKKAREYTEKVMKEMEKFIKKLEVTYEKQN